jgi:rhodanese-related sulfurtransferase
MTIPEIDVDELATRLERGAVLFDVREPNEYAEAHVAGAVLVPLATVPDAVDRFQAAGGPVHVICRSGGRSARAVEFLRERGVDAVNVAGGTLAWLSSGRAHAAGLEPA